MIRVLDELVINRIAAGEVVDRPSSAVKELVENALDAGARRVRVKLEGGGLDLISVEDDGAGMVAEDLRKSWLRHATSKMVAFEDLANVGTYGFRGEALSSLASVAELRIDTRHVSEPEGRAIVVHGGNLVTDAPSGWPRGTRVEVRGLFAGIPVRRRFLGTAQAEAQRVLNSLVRQALARPDVEFRLSHGDRELLAVNAGDRRMRVRDLLGRVVEGMVPVEWSDGNLTVTGFVGGAGTDRGRADMAHFSVNRRPIQAGVLVRGVARGLGLNPGRHPVCVLEITLPLEEVDINVHPQKREVRFQAEGPLFHAVSEAVSGALDLRGELPLFSPSSPEDGKDQGAQPPRYAALPGFEPEPPHAQTDSVSPDAFPFPSAGELDDDRPPVAAFDPPTPASRDQGDLFASRNPTLVAFPGSQRAPEPSEPVRAFSQAGIQILQVEGYLLCPLQGGLLCIDQRAAHERVLFEQALRGLEREGAVPSQQLLFPRPIDLPVRERQTALAHLEDLRALSFDLEPFGGTTLLLRGVPASIPQDDAEGLLEDLLGAVAEEGPSRDTLHRAFAAGYARAAALRRTQELGAEERSALADDLFACREPWQTPGGAPTVTRISSVDLSRFFR
ncbi:MAG: DNA mismatch repair endonuclease MutL [Fibrobacteria bacterium]|nr:DNA mismatch repair endonuclease MutL [Fibrobacteria bacterium]